MAVVIAAAVGAVVATALGLWAWSERRRARETTAALRTASGDATRSRADADAARQGLEALAEGIVLLERTGTAVYVTGPARDLVGRKFASAAELTPGALRAACERMLESATPEELEFETAGRTVAAAVLPVPSGGGVVVLRDVT